MLDQVAEAGYAGIDLGPVGYLGTGERLGELLAERGLGLAGAYLELPYADHDALEQALPDLDDLLSTFDAVRAYLPGPAAAADAGRRRAAADRRSLPGRSAGQHSLGLDADGWRRFADRPGPRGRPLPRPRLRADLPPGDRDLRRGAVGDRARCSTAPTSGCAWRPGT